MARCQPSGGGAFLADNHAGFSASAGALTPQEKLLAGEGLGLDPENDPVVFTTDYGLEIKSHNAAGLVDVKINDPSSSGTINVSSTSWNYISAGGYNWIIIGSYSTSSYTISTLTGTQYQTIGSLADSTPAGRAVKGESSKQVIEVNDVTIPAFSNAKEGYNGEVPQGCVLCLCQNNITTTAFRSSGNDYVGSTLESYINDTVYGSTSELSIALQALPIVPQSLTTLYYDSATSTINNAYLFPLSGINNTESFYVGTYLDTSTKRNIGAQWWLRSGSTTNSVYAYSINSATGEINYFSYNENFKVYRSYGVRPAFVLQLYSV